MSHQFAGNGKEIKEVVANGDGEGGEDGFSRGGDGNKPDAPPSGLPCPRCSSTNSKFCYFNNGKTSQPRYYCRDCKRYWTHGGSLRNIPIGGGCRKRGRHSSDASTSASVIVMRPLASLSLKQRIRLVISTLAAAFISAINNNDGMSDQMQQMPSQQPTLPATNMQYFGSNSGGLVRDRVNQSCYANRVQMYNYYASVQQQQQQQQQFMRSLQQQPNNQPMQQLNMQFPQQQITHPRPLYQPNPPMEQVNLRPVHQHIQPVQQIYQHPMQQHNQRPFQQRNQYPFQEPNQYSFQQPNQYPFQQPNQPMQQYHMRAPQQSNLRPFQQVHQRAVHQPNLRPLQQANQPMVEHHVMQQRPIAAAPQNEHQLFNYPNAVVREMIRDPPSITLDDWIIINNPSAELLVDNNACASTSNNLNQEDNNHLADKLGTSRFDDQTGSSS